MEPVKVSVYTSRGKVRGFQQETAWGKRFFSFLGIPYAKPPVGPLRFKPPQPAERWQQVLECSKERNVAPQFHMITGDYVGDEDCLYLNVYTPHVAHSRPVMVWIHGGGFGTGSGSRDLYGPEYLLQQDVVLVTINYRLGALGFMSTGDNVISGNMGLKDQVMALRWVKDNIIQFGGDPNNVTIFGESAGSVSCQLLTLSPMAKGLFQRAILMSGVVVPGSFDQPIKDRTYRLAHYLGLVPGASSVELLEYLHAIPASKLVLSQRHAASPLDTGASVIYPFMPVKEAPDAEGGPFITEDPVELLKRGAFDRVPIVAGVTSGEGIFRLKDSAAQTKVLDALNADDSKLVPEIIPVKEGDKKAVGQKLKNFYFGDKPIGVDTAQQYNELVRDNFAYLKLEVAKRISSLPEAEPLYFYYFDVDARHNFLKKFWRAEHVKGASHVDDLCYLFRWHMANPEVEAGSIEERAILHMTKLFTNFAKTGNPTPPDEAANFGVTWSPFSAGDPAYLHVSNDGISLKRELLKDRIAFWAELTRQ